MPLKFVSHENGFAEFGTGETESEVEVSAGASTFTIGAKTCKISWPAQTIPAKAIKYPEAEFSAVSYSTTETEVAELKWKKYPTHKQQRLLISSELKHVQYVYEGGQCVGEGGFEEEAKSTGGSTGKYIGMIEEEIPGGNLGFTETP